MNVRLVKTKIYDDLSLQTYLQGLNGQLGLVVRLKNPKNLEEAMKYVTEEENVMYSQNKTSTLNFQRNYQPVEKKTPTQPIRPVVTHPATNSNFYQQRQNFHRQQPIYRQPNFSLPRQFSNRFSPQQSNASGFHSPKFTQQRFNQNPSGRFQQVGQRPQHYNGPRFESKQSQFFQPEPMDTSSANTRKSNYPSTPRWTSHELFHQDVKENQEEFYGITEYNQYGEDAIENELYCQSTEEPDSEINVNFREDSTNKHLK